MIANMKTNQQMNALKSAYEHYKKVMHPSNKKDDAEMDDQSQETPEAIRKRILAKYNSIL